MRWLRNLLKRMPQCNLAEEYTRVTSDLIV